MVINKNKQKSIIWLGSSLEDLKKFPRDVQRDVGFVLYRAQIGKHHHNIKPLKGLNGVMEIVSFYATDTYRTVYTIKLGKRIYVLHAFKKKSKKASKTPKPEMEIIKQRLKRAKELAKEES